MTNQGCVSKVRTEHDLYDCRAYSVGQNSMDEGQFATWELTKQRKSITPANLWTVTRITEDREELACIDWGSWQIRNGGPRDTPDRHSGTLVRILAVC